MRLSASVAVALLLALLAAPAAHAQSVSLEMSASQNFRAWSLLGDVPLQEDRTFLTFGYTGSRPEPGTAATHQLSLGVDHALSLHWLLSGAVLVGLPKSSLTPLAPERPVLKLPGLAARSGHKSLGLNLAAAYDSAGFSDVEYGLDAGLGLTRYTLRRQMLTREDGDLSNLFAREEPLYVARPSLGGRLMLGVHWELGLRAGAYLYSEDPLTAGQFSEKELDEVRRRYTSEAEGRAALLAYLSRQFRDLGSALLEEGNAVTGFPSAPARFDVKPSVTYRFNAAVRGQLSYAFTRYVPGQGVAHVLATRWTVRVSEPVRLWASVALQSDVPEGLPAARTGLLTLGGEYTF